MSRDQPDEAAKGVHIDDARSRVDALESQLPPDSKAVTDRLSGIRTQITEYQRAESEEEQQDVLDQIESELDQARTAVDEEVDQGAARAHDLLDEIETKLSNLR